MDNIFALNILINLVQNRRKKLSCAFDLKRAFDTVWRDGVFYKMKLFYINGKCYNVVKNMYRNIKSCVSVNGKSSNFSHVTLVLDRGQSIVIVIFNIFERFRRFFMSEC